MRWLRHPTTIALVFGLIGAAAALWLWAYGPQVDSMVVGIPPWLAELLGDSSNQEVIINRPEALWLMPAAVGPFVLAVLWRSLVDVRGFQVVFQTFARLLVLLAAALAFSLPSLESPIRGKTVVAVVDVSESVDDGQLEAARRVVRDLAGQVDAEAATEIDREDRTRFALITYGGRARVHLSEDPQELLQHVQRDPEAALASDHAGALRLAAALIDPNTEGRVVLVTDGAGSLAEREDLTSASQELERNGITLHTRSYAPKPREDVLVEAVHLPAELRVGQSFDVSIDLMATEPGKLTLELLRDGTPNPLAPLLEVDLRGGRQTVKMPARVTKPGPVVFTARLKTEALTEAQNRTTGNDAAAVAGDVRGRPRILLAGAEGGGALPRALRADHLAVDVVSPGAIPATAEGLRPYDLVIISDVAARRVGGAAQQAISKYVNDQGGGFIMIGGENAFGLGGWNGTPIERLLPVKFEGERQREQPKLALLLVIDKSGSMSSEDKLDLVKEASRATARTLDPTDELGVIAFDSRPHVLVRLQPASNRIRISADIRRLTAGGGTNALPALRESYLQLAGSNALVKHVILLSDGQSPEAGIAALLGDMRDADITVSSVGVGAGAGKDFLRRVANRGRGRFYYSHDGTDVPRIFSRETREVTRNAVVEQNLLPRVAKNVQALRGIDFGRAPGLRGIIPLKAKAMSETILRTHMGDPLLVRGRRGLGRTAAFASDAKARWASRWVTWGGFAKFWSQVARDTMRQGATMLGGVTMSVSPAADLGAYRVVADVDSPAGFANDLVGEVAIIDPSVPKDAEGHEVLVPLELSAPGRYEAEVLDVRSGQRLLKTRLFDESQQPRRLAAEGVAQVSVPYPTELAPQHLVPQPEILTAMATGTSDGEVSAVVDTPGDPKGRTRQKALWPYAVFGLLLPLLLLDLLLRRISLGLRKLTV